MNQSIDPEQLQDYRTVFNLFDADGSGSIDVTELGIAFRSLGHNVPEEELAEILREVDDDGTGCIDFDEFVKLLNRKAYDEVLLMQIASVFKEFDTDGDGWLGLAEIVQAVAVFAGVEMSEEEAAVIIMEGNHTTDRIDLKEFTALMIREAPQV